MPARVLFFLIPLRLFKKVPCLFNKRVPGTVRLYPRIRILVRISAGFLILPSNTLFLLFKYPWVR